VKSDPPNSQAKKKPEDWMPAASSRIHDEIKKSPFPDPLTDHLEALVTAGCDENELLRLISNAGMERLDDERAPLAIVHSELFDLDELATPDNFGNIPNELNFGTRIRKLASDLRRANRGEWMSPKRWIPSRKRTSTESYPSRLEAEEARIHAFMNLPATLRAYATYFETQRDWALRHKTTLSTFRTVDTEVEVVDFVKSKTERPHYEVLSELLRIAYHAAIRLSYEHGTPHWQSTKSRGHFTLTHIADPSVIGSLASPEEYFETIATLDDKRFTPRSLKARVTRHRTALSRPRGRPRHS
jgi:hypothetical protein